MAPTRTHPKALEGFMEVASPELLDDKWAERFFDLASQQNALRDQDLVSPETAGGYAFREAGAVGSATHNRFIYWRAYNDFLELVEISTEVLLDNNQVRIKFLSSPIVYSVNIIELSDSIVIVVATLNSVHRFTLPHPKATSKSVLSELTNDVIIDPSNYYILDGNPSGNSKRHPMCASSWAEDTSIKCALSFPDSSILLVQFSTQSHHIGTTEIKQISIIGKIWSRLNRGLNECENAVFLSVPYLNEETNEVLLFCLCRDWKIRVFSTATKICVLTFNGFDMQRSFSTSISNHPSPSSEPPLMKMHKNNLIIYFDECDVDPDFVVLTYSYEDGNHHLKSRFTLPSSGWDKLIDFSITDRKIWALATTGEAESTLWCVEISEALNEDETNGQIDTSWQSILLSEELENSTVDNYVAQIFWRNRFSVKTIQKALVGMLGPNVPKSDSREALENLAFTRFVGDDQNKVWQRFYDYCMQIHQTSNKDIGLVTANDESLVALIKRSNPSLICPCLTNVDLILRSKIYRGIYYTKSITKLMDPLKHISSDLINEETYDHFERRLFEDLSCASSLFEEMIPALVKSKKINNEKLTMSVKDMKSSIESIINQLDLTSQASHIVDKALNESSKQMRSEYSAMSSDIGIIITFEFFKKFVRARMNLLRDLLIYIYFLISPERSSCTKLSKSMNDVCEELPTKLKPLLDLFRTYAIFVWISETPIKSFQKPHNLEVIEMISNKFKFFKKSSNSQPKDNGQDLVIHQNLFMNFLINGGIDFSNASLDVPHQSRTITSSYYLTDVVLNICRLLWPKVSHLCFAEYLFTNHFDEQLDKYLNLTDDWVQDCEGDRQFLKASNYLVQRRSMQAVNIYNQLWTNIRCDNLIGRFIELSQDSSTSEDIEESISTKPTTLYRYYDKLIQLCQTFNQDPSLVLLINHCMTLLDIDDDQQKSWVNSLKAKLFQCYLELGESNEAYNTMVLTSDPSLRINCLRKLIVHHCEREEWATLLAYPFIDIRDDFVEILNQRATSSDLSRLNRDYFHKLSYYELLFSYHVSEDQFLSAAQVMYSYAVRLAQEVPGVVSIRKQEDSLITALTTLKCVPKDKAFFQYRSGDGKSRQSNGIKRAHCDSDSDICLDTSSESNFLRPTSDLNSTLEVNCSIIRMKYELTRARLKLLEKDQLANAIVLSPLRPEEIIIQLVASSMFSTAIKLALLFQKPMEPILEGLAARYVFIVGTSDKSGLLDQDLERDLADLFTNCQTNTEIYNSIANSDSPIADRLWRLINHYLQTYDGISHTYSNPKFNGTFSKSTVLMRPVAVKLLSAGLHIPASLRSMYALRNPAELLRLLIKYNKLIDAADLAMEMIEESLEPALSYQPVSNNPPPVYLPTHTMLTLMKYLKEDATNDENMCVASAVDSKLSLFRAWAASA